MKSDVFYMSMLFDFYGELLTDKQKEFFDLYYNNDMSLSEISEIANISRQGVRDAIMRAEEILRDTEDKLRLVRKYSGYEDKLRDIFDSAQYISILNSSGAKNYEIAVRSEHIMNLSKELMD